MSAATAAPSSSSAASAAAAEVADTAYSTPGAPSVTNDPRFRAGRKLVVNGKADRGAVGFFATLVEESRSKYGDASIEAAPCYYEYGNALFRARVRQNTELNLDLDEDESDAGKDEDAKKPAAKVAPPNDGKSSSSASSSVVRSAAAEAAERRLAAAAMPVEKREDADAAKNVQKKAERKAETKETNGESHAPKRSESDDGNGEAASKSASTDTTSIDDTSLALELMENAWCILDQYVSDDADATSGDGERSKHMTWARGHLPRVLTGLGDVLSDLGRHADASDVYTRALAHREATVAELAESSASDGAGLGLLAARRHLVEANVLVAEELLACPAGEDVVTAETGDVLVKSAERAEYARGYYDKARDGLQEAVFLMGKLAAAGTDLGTEKEDVCYLATMVMAVGTALAELEEDAGERAPKKLKTG